MNGIDGKNSTWQRDAASDKKDIIKEAVIENLEIEKVLSGSTKFAIADLGCWVGPDTFYSMQTLIEAVQHNYHRQSNGSTTSDNLEFHVFFNDQTSNDFNTLFASLPHPRNYFAAGVPGSFHTRLFPSSSIHIVYSSNAVIWLSKVPEGMQVKDSPAWNAGKIHYTGASDAVVKAYADQFEQDMEVFLRARNQEIAPGGMIVIQVPGIPLTDVPVSACFMITFIESILMDMVKEGVLEEDLVDSFNLLTFFPTIKDMRRVVDKNGCFEIAKLETADFGNVDGESIIMYLRATLQGIICNHFSKEIFDQLFARAMQKKLDFNNGLQSTEMGVTCMLFAVLKRKLNL